VTKVRLTGGEPLLRRGIDQLVAMVAAIPGVEDLAMTTNGFLFPARARALREAGLQRVNLSLDSLERSMFQRITGRDGLDEVLRSIALARELGFHPLKVNAVIIRGLNDSEVTALAGFARHEEVRMRFIEFMPLDAAHNWSRDMLVPGAEILERLRERFQLTPVASSPSETARRYRFDRGAGELGIIAPVTEPFCGHCNRIRLTADGKLRTCLFSHTEHDLKQVLRDGSSDAGLAQRLRETVLEKEDRHHIGEPIFTPPERTMSCIGG
jgi:cyclic pyranopterin phosphate synthase